MRTSLAVPVRERTLDPVERLDWLRRITEQPGFRAALAAGATLVAASLVAALALRRVRRDPTWRLPEVGLGAAAAVLVGWSAAGTISPGAGTLAGVAGLAVAGAWARGDPGRAMPAALPGALLLGASLDLRRSDWLVVLAVAAAVVGTAALGGFDRDRPGISLLLWAGTVLGTWATVPETSSGPSVLAAAVVPFALLGLPPRPLGTPGPAGAGALVGLWAWATLQGGQYRPASVVGALACLGVLVVAPLSGRVARARGRTPATGAVLLLAVHAGLVVVAARVAGLLDSVPLALAVVAVAVVAATTVLVAAAEPTMT